MFANYRVGAITSRAKVKFENVEENQHPDYALLGEVLEDIKKNIRIGMFRYLFLITGIRK